MMKLSPHIVFDPPKRLARLYRGKPWSPGAARQVMAYSREEAALRCGISYSAWNLYEKSGLWPFQKAPRARALAAFGLTEDQVPPRKMGGRQARKAAK